MVIYKYRLIGVKIKAKWTFIYPMHWQGGMSCIHRGISAYETSNVRKTVKLNM